MGAAGMPIHRLRAQCEPSPDLRMQSPSSRKPRGRKCPALALVQGKTVLPGSATNLYTNVLPLCADRSCQEILPAYRGKFAVPEVACHSTPAHFRVGSSRPQFACPARECDKTPAVQHGFPRLASSHTRLRFVAINSPLWNREAQMYISAANRRSRSLATTCVPARD